MAQTFLMVLMLQSACLSSGAAFKPPQGAKAIPHLASMNQF